MMKKIINIMSGVAILFFIISNSTVCAVDKKHTGLTLEITDKKDNVILLTNVTAKHSTGATFKHEWTDDSGLLVSLGAGEVTIPWNKITKVILSGEQLNYDKGGYPAQFYFTDGEVKEMFIRYFDLIGDTDLGFFKIYVGDCKQIVIKNQKGK